MFDCLQSTKISHAPIFHDGFDCEEINSCDATFSAAIGPEYLLYIFF